MSTSPNTSAPADPGPQPVLTWVALAIAFLGSAGSLYLSMGMKLEACALCFYQRAFVMAVMAVLGLGLVAGVGRPVSLSLLALPMSLAGLGIAAFHVNLELNGTLECPEGLFKLGTAPKQSLAVFALLTVVLFVDVLRSSAPKLEGITSALAIGVALTAGCLNSNPPLAPLPSKEWDKPLLGCRRPYVAPE